MDDVATKDYPAAVAKVLELSGAETVQIVAHGVGSSTFTMAMLAGLRRVRAAVCSQVSTHLQVPLLNRLKAGLRLPTVEAALGMKTMTAYVDKYADWKARFYDSLVKLYPMDAEERCNSSVCRRITVMYGTLYEHDQLGEATHQALHEMFGTVNISAVRQLARITRKGYLVGARGENVYLPFLERLAIPIAFIHGAENECVLPKSTEITYDLLRQRNSAKLYSRHIIPGYGHVDCIIGKNAAKDVYPFILKHLER
jgi:cholesterol oxidase